MRQSLKTKTAPGSKQPRDARHVWCDDTGRGRNLYACFRRTLRLKAAPRSARIHLFADSDYQLFVNGRFVECGPVRFDPRYPLFDTVNIAPFLRAGENVIAVSANSFQQKTYKAIEGQAGFIAWGHVLPRSGPVIPLATPGDWRAIPNAGHARYAAKFSFALNAADLFDQEFAPSGWEDTGFDDSAWPAAVCLADQSAWGPLAPRSIPMLTHTPVPITAVPHVLPLRRTEDLFSFSVPFPAFYEDSRKEFGDSVVFTTWVFSPVNQEVSAGMHWFDCWLNGRRLPGGVESTSRALRATQRWALRAGWNHVFGVVRAYQDVIEPYIALPRGLGLVVSADRTLDGTCRFKHTPLLAAEKFRQHVACKPMPFSHDEELREIGGWVRASDSDAAQSPMRELSWDDYGDVVETLTPGELAGHTFPLAIYPNGFSVLLDAGQTRLTLPRLSAKGVAGATIDLGYSERLFDDGMHLLLEPWHPCCDRMLCARDTIDWMPSHPRGFRYLKITVRKARNDVTFTGLSWSSASYPVRRRGKFSCSDPLLANVWEMCERTQSTNMEDAYVDCVGRERGMYARDTVIQYHVNLATFGDQKLMGRCMQLYGQSTDATGRFRAVFPTRAEYVLVDFALELVNGYESYYLHSGDLERVRQDWGAIRTNLAWFHHLSDLRPDGLLESDFSERRGIAAPYGGFHGDGHAKDYNNAKGAHCGFSCEYLSAMQSATRLAKALGRSEDLPELRKRSAALARSIRAAFWDPRHGCYADNLERRTHSAQASLMAVLAGAATPAQTRSLRRHVEVSLGSMFRNGYDPAEGCLTAPSYSHFLFEGLYRLGLSGVAENLMRQGWGWMLAKGLPTCPEFFHLKASHCHAWSASPAYYLSKHLLGVEFPEAPDLDHVTIRVQATGVTSAQGAWPHPRGLIEVKWHTSKGRRVFDYIRAPQGVRIKSQ